MAAQAYDYSAGRLAATGSEGEPWMKGAIEFTKKSLSVSKEIRRIRYLILALLKGREMKLRRFRASTVIKKTFFQADSKRLRWKSREKPTSGGVLFLVHWNEAVERSEADGPFSSQEALRGYRVGAPRPQPGETEAQLNDPEGNLFPVSERGWQWSRDLLIKLGRQPLR